MIEKIIIEILKQREEELKTELSSEKVTVTKLDIAYAMGNVINRINPIKTYNDVTENAEMASALAALLITELFEREDEE